MGLFSTLTSSAANAEGGKTRNSTLDIQNVLQLYAGSSPILVEKNAKVRKCSVLSYQTVHVASSAAQEGGALLSNMEKEATSLHPNLGVWNCRVTKHRNATTSADEKPLADAIFSTLPQSDTTHPAICMSVDLSNLAQVEPTISLLQDALVRYLIARPAVKSGIVISPTATTSLFDLRSTHFGLATNDEESAKNMSKSAPAEGDKKIAVSLAISVLLPSRHGPEDGDDAAGNNNDEYKDKQAEALVVYHLRKYAASLNAVLCFARKDKAAAVTEDDDQESKGIDALTLHQLSFVWQQIAKGEDGWKELDHSSNTNTEGESAASTSVSGIYGPGHHHEDLIESVLLRNAQFPGQWDAAKDSLWVALPPPADATSEEATNLATTSGDEGWLNELRSSVASDAIKSPPPKDAKKGDAADAKTPGDADVSSFFESLLKP